MDKATVLKLMQRNLNLRVWINTSATALDATRQQYSRSSHVTKKTRMPVLLPVTPLLLLWSCTKIASSPATASAWTWAEGPGIRF